MLGEGVTGILKPCGEFVECEYGHFMQLVNNLPTKEQKDIIILSSLGNGIQGTVYKYSLEIGGTMSNKQYEWLKEHYDFLSLNQKGMVYDWLGLLSESIRMVN